MSRFDNFSVYGPRGRTTGAVFRVLLEQKNGGKSLAAVGDATSSTKVTVHIKLEAMQHSSSSGMLAR
jgi:hypothetical protein